MSLPIKKKMFVNTERLTLRPYEQTDIDSLVELLTYAEIAETFILPDYPDIEQFRTLAEKLINFSRIEDYEHLEYGIYLENRLIGFINDCGIEDSEIEIGYVIHPDFKGNGYATEAVQAVLSELHHMGFSKVTAGFFSTNAASRRVMEKCGMRLNDTIEDIEYRGKTHKCEYCEICFDESKEENAMNTPVMDTILARRSIRHFEDKPVEREKVELMLKAAMAAPSACNLQPWAFIAVDDADMLENVKKAAEQGRYNAPLAIVVCGITEHIPWDGNGWLQDCGAAAQNILLAATEMGLGGVWIGGFDEGELCKALDIPDEVTPMCIIMLGYPAYTLTPRTWYTEEAVHWQRFDSKKPRKLRSVEMLHDDIKNGRMN